MRKAFLAILILGIFLSAHASARMVEDMGQLSVLVTGLRSNHGVVKIGLYNTREGYLSRGKIPAFRSAKLPIDNYAAQFTFKPIPAGTYTAKLYHDENSNGTIDKNFLGIPSEDYGFSNNPKVLFGLPKYSKVTFTVSADPVMLRIKVK